MKTLYGLTALLGLALTLGSIQGEAYAFKGEHKGKREGEKKGWHAKGLKAKFFKKAHFLLMNEKELGLTKDQREKIVKLKVETKKRGIRQTAEIDVLKVDIMSALYADQIDVAAVSELIDKKYDVKKVKAKGLVQAIADLKSTLSASQREKMKDLYMDQKKRR